MKRDFIKAATTTAVILGFVLLPVEAANRNSRQHSHHECDHADAEASKPKKCKTCNGKGIVKTKGRGPCSPCNGTGKYKPKVGAQRACMKCAGRGYLNNTTIEATCNSCGGSGESY